MPRTIRYARDAESLFRPGRADDFFESGIPRSRDALCAEMARLAYVKHEEPSGRARLDQFLARVGFTVRRPLDAHGTQGFIADGAHEGRPVRVIAFRGTEPDEPRDTRADLLALPRPWEGLAIVHLGFATALSHVGRDVTAAMTETPNDTDLLVTGHSLGAALATLAASRHPRARLYTFGSPRVGNAAFTAMIGADRHTRYVDHVDVVTTVPPHHSVFGCVHLEPAHFIDVDGVVHRGVSDEDVRQRQRAANCPVLSVRELVDQFRAHGAAAMTDVALRHLTDHAPINYVAPLMPLLTA